MEKRAKRDGKIPGAAWVCACVFALGAAGCAAETMPLDLPFAAEDVVSAEMFHYDGVPAAAEKKDLTEPADLEALYGLLDGLELREPAPEEVSGASVTSFRFRLADGSEYEGIYSGAGVKSGKLTVTGSSAAYETSADIGSAWSNLAQEDEPVPADADELPVIR